MRTEVSLETRIKDQCALAGYDYEYLYRFGKKLLKLYRDVSRNNTLDAEDILEDICSESYESDISSQMSSALTVGYPKVAQDRLDGKGDGSGQDERLHL